MEKGLFFLIESEGELAEEVPKFNANDPDIFFKSESSRILELSEALRSLGRRADFEFAQQAYCELEGELKNARRLLRSIDRSPPEILGRRLEKTAETLGRIGSEIIQLHATKESKLEPKERENYKLKIKHTNLATAHLRATSEREFLRGLEEKIGRNLSELERILTELSPTIKQAYLPSLSNNLEKTLKKQQRALTKIRGNKNAGRNTKVFMDCVQEALMELKTINGKLIPFLEKTYEALELLGKALSTWAELHAFLLKYAQDWNSLNKGIGQVLEGADFNSIPRLERRLPTVEPPALPIPAKQALFLKNRVLEVNWLLSDAQWKIYAKMQATPEKAGTSAPTAASPSAKTAADTQTSAAGAQ